VYNDLDNLKGSEVYEITLKRQKPLKVDLEHVYSSLLTLFNEDVN